MFPRHILIESAAKQVDELTVMVCSIKNEPISGALRYAWMKAIFPHLRVIHVTDENPQEPEDDPQFWKRQDAAPAKVG